jgi:hypothetical protein
MALEPQPVTSFVLRFSPAAENGEGDRRWRIRITHVQEQEEVFVGSMEEAVAYMEAALNKGRTG